MSHKHNKLVCRDCTKVVSTCRCSAPKEEVLVTCDDCKKIKLAEEDIDSILKDRDKRKLLRKLIDDQILPASALAAGAGASAAEALAKLKQGPKIYEV